jgi:hypothetical protein
MAKRKTSRVGARRTRLRAARSGGQAARKQVRQVRTKARKPAARPPANKTPDVLLAPLRGATRRTVGHVQLEVGRAGAARVKRMVYPAGFRWSVDMKPVVGTDLCMHAHVGFLASGRFTIEYADGCRVEARAPQIVAIDPGHDGWVVGKDPAVFIEFDFEGDTVARLGMPAAHRHE